MKPEIALKTSIDVAHIRKTCRLLEETFQFLKGHITDGISTRDLDRLVVSFVTKRSARSALKGYKGFPNSICTSVNNVAAHGIPRDHILENGDIVSIDITLVLEGWHGDGTWTYIVGDVSPDVQRLVKAAWQANTAGILAVKAGAHLGDVGFAISGAVRKNGCSVIQDYVGHGIGESMHEDPVIPNFGERNQGMRIVPGMVFTVEPIVCLGVKEVKTLDDGWTVVTGDNSLCAQFEHTLAVFRDKVEVLTLSTYKLEDHIDCPPFI